MKTDKVRTKLMEKISKSEVKMKPKWQFTLQATSFKGIWLLSILAGAIALSVIGYFIILYNPRELILEYGVVGRQLLLTDFPYLWLGGALVFFVGGAILFSKLGLNYKRQTKIVLLITSVLIVVATVAIMAIRLWLKL